MGGGTAVLTTMMIMSRNDYLDQKRKKDLKCVTFGSPPVFRSDKNDNKYERNINIFINQNDIVPRLSLHTLSNLLSAIRKDLLQVKKSQKGTNLKVFP